MARLTRWGNSDGGLRIPKHIVDAAGLRVVDEIGCRLLDSGAILLIPRTGRVDISEGNAKAESNKTLRPSGENGHHKMLAITSPLA